MPRNIITRGNVDPLLPCRCDILRKAMLADPLTVKKRRMGVGGMVVGWQQVNRGNMGGVR